MVAPSLALILYRPDGRRCSRAGRRWSSWIACCPRRRRSILGAVKTYHLTTFGCQMNEHDSERMKGMLESLGYSEAGDRAAPT